ncbi:stalk domain-containing protein [Wukongibacter baidiensis]|uniref:stalk domain-containing protein n=1 Tax=Wukongibacter baidiensis TaxID=1723361 RepID=UPI003D7FEF20
MKRYFKGYIAGLVTALCLTVVSTAYPISKSINVVFDNYKIYVNGTLTKMTDVNEKTLEPLNYNGSIYLPIRAISNAFDEDVTWESDTKSVYIGKLPNSSPSTKADDKIPDIEGIKLFPKDNIWNTPVDKLPIHPKSDTFISIIGKDKRLHPDFGTFWKGSPIGIPYNIVSSDQNTVDVTFDYASESDKGPYPIPNSPLIEGGSDRHLLILQKDTNTLYELFAAERLPNGKWHAGSGAIWHLDKNEQRPKGWTSADASGLAILPGLVRWDEVYKKGEINHAFRVTLSKIQKAYVLPATHSGGKYADPSYPPMGLRLRLKSDFDISEYNEDMQIILRAMKKYGLIVADVGSDMYVSGAHDTRWNDEALSALKKLKASDFEAVYTGEPIPYK